MEKPKSDGVYPPLLDRTANGAPTPLTSVEKAGGDEVLEARDKWTSWLDFVLSCVGYAVGLGNFWRWTNIWSSNSHRSVLYFSSLDFPTFAMRMGAALFFCPTSCASFSAGFPFSYWKHPGVNWWTSVASVCGRSAQSSKVIRVLCSQLASLANMCRSTGVGIGAVVMAFWLNVSYIVVLAWALYYLFAAFASDLPWRSCSNAWNSPCCRDEYELPDNISRTLNETLRLPQLQIQPWVQLNSSICPANFSRSSPVQEYWEWV